MEMINGFTQYVTMQHINISQPTRLFLQTIDLPSESYVYDADETHSVSLSTLISFKKPCFSRTQASNSEPIKLMNSNSYCMDLPIIHRKPTIASRFDITLDEHLFQGRTTTSKNKVSLTSDGLGTLEFLVKELRTATTNLGEYHEEVAEKEIKLAQKLIYGEEYQRALGYLDKAFRFFSSDLGRYINKIILIQHLRANIYIFQSKFQEALDELYKIRTIKEQNTRHKAIVGAETYDKIADCLIISGSHREATIALQQSLDLQGDSKEQVITCQFYFTLKTLAIIKCIQGKYNEALDLIKQSLHLCINNEGPESLEQAEIYEAFGYIAKSMGNYKEALSQYQRSLEIRVKNNDDNSIIKARVYNSLASLHILLGKLLEAKTYTDIAYNRLSEKYENGELRELADCYTNYGDIYELEDNLTSSVEYHQKSLAIKEQIYGKVHLETADSYLHLGKIRLKLGEFSKAEDFLKTAAETKSQILGRSHPQIAEILVEQALAKICLGQHNSVEELLEEARTIYLEFFSEEHHRLARIHSAYGFFHFKRSEWEKSRKLLVKSLYNYIKNFGEDHPQVVYLYERIADTYLSEKQLEKTIHYSKKCIEIAEKLFGDKHPVLASAYRTLSEAYRQKGRTAEFEEAQKLMVEVEASRDGESHSVNSHTDSTQPEAKKEELSPRISIRKTSRYPTFTISVKNIDSFNQSMISFPHDLSPIRKQMADSRKVSREYLFNLVQLPQ